jgi:excisionase family DNA binding protein
MNRAWFKVKTAADYIDVSDKTMRRMLKKGVPFVRLPGGSIRIHRPDLDEFMEQFLVHENEVETVVNEIISELGVR